MTQQQRESVAGMLRASPFDPAGDLREQRRLFDKMIAAAPVPADVVTTPRAAGRRAGHPHRHSRHHDRRRHRVLPRRVLRHRLGSGGPDGGHILAAGTPEDVARKPDSATGPWLGEHLGLSAAHGIPRRSVMPCAAACVAMRPSRRSARFGTATEPKAHPVQSARRLGPAGCARYAPGQDARERVCAGQGRTGATASGAVSAGSNPAGGTVQRTKFEHNL